MPRRASQSPESKALERESNRLRMAAKLANPEYRACVNAKRKARDAERKAKDKSLRTRLTANSLAHYHRRAPDPEFWIPRKAYYAAWIRARRDDEAFEFYMARMENGD